MLIDNTVQKSPWTEAYLSCTRVKLYNVPFEVGDALSYLIKYYYRIIHGFLYKGNILKTIPACGEGGPRSPPATPHRLQNPKWPPGGPKMANRVWKGFYP